MKKRGPTVNAIFAWIGKVITVLAALVGIVAVVLEIAPKGPRVRAVVTASDYGVPNYYFDLLQDARGTVTSKKLKDWFAANEIEVDSAQVSSLYRALLPERHQEHIWENMYQSLWFIRISNRGNEPAEAVVLDTPFIGIARIDLGAGRKLENEVQGTVEIGDLRPQTSVDVWVWARRGPTVRAVESMTISYAEGIGKIKYTVTSWGWAKWWALHHQTVLWAASGLAAFLLLVSRAIKRRGSRLLGKAASATIDE